jgi:hypothetical protein
VSHVVTSREGVTLRQAALIAAIGVLLGLGVPLAEFVARPILIIPGNIEETIQSIGANQGLFVASIFAYFIAFAADVVVAWALYVLLVPVNRELAMLTAWFRLFFAIIGLGALMNMVTAFRIITTNVSLEGSEQLAIHINVLLNSFHWEWGLGMVLFGVHLGLLGYLTYRSGYIPRAIGVGLGIAGLGYMVYYLQPYLYPDLDLPFLILTITGLGELALLFWLLARGSRIGARVEGSSSPT